MTKAAKINYTEFISRASVYFPLAFTHGEISSDTGIGANFKMIPDRLYKYCSIYEYYIDAIKNRYLYMCPADKLDDSFEVAMRFFNETFSNISEDKFEGNYIWYLLDSIKGVNPKFDDEFTKIKQKIGSRSSRRKIEEFYNQEANKYRKDQLWIEIESKMNDPVFQSNVEQFFSILRRLKDTIGIHSLTTFKDSQIMWEMYGAKREGMMIEYDIASALKTLKARLLPVNYSNRRDADPLKLFFDLIALAFKGESKQAERYFYKWILKAMCTKNKEWSLQEEWRVIGDKEERFPAPPIKAVYLGSKVSEYNKQELIKLSEEKGFKVFYQYEDFETMKIRYKPLIEEKEECI